jgi:hypothetical protein
MVDKTKLDSQEDLLRERIRALKQEIRDREPTLDDIVRFVQENHPKRQEQYLFEQQLRRTQGELADIEEQRNR